MELPYSSNVIKSFLIYLYTNAPPVSTVNYNSQYSPVLTDAKLTDLAQLAKEFGLPQLVQYCNLLKDTSLQFEIEQPPNDISEMFQHFGLEMDRTCFYISVVQSALNEEALKKGLAFDKVNSLHAHMHACICAHTYMHYIYCMFPYLFILLM